MAKKNINIIMTIEELYNWAKKNHCENYTVLLVDDITRNIYKTEIIISREDEEVCL